MSSMKREVRHGSQLLVGPDECGEDDLVDQHRPDIRREDRIQDRIVDQRDAKRVGPALGAPQQAMRVQLPGKQTNGAERRKAQTTQFQSAGEKRYHRARQRTAQGCRRRDLRYAPPAPCESKLCCELDTHAIAACTVRRASRSAATRRFWPRVRCVFTKPMSSGFVVEAPGARRSGRAARGWIRRDRGRTRARACS